MSFRYTIARNPKKEICRNLNYITQELEEVQGTYSCDKEEGTKSELRSCVKVEVLVRNKSMVSVDVKQHLTKGTKWPHPPPPPHISLSLISITVFVDVKHHVYLLTNGQTNAVM